jgi:hypothetical protein
MHRLRRDDVSILGLMRVEVTELVGVIGLPCEALCPDAADAGFANN